MSDLYRELDTPTFRLAVAQFEEAAERLRLDHNLRERLKIPQRALIVSVPVRMDDGSVKVFVGYRVQHDTALGPSKGGVRFHPEVNLGEVAALAMDDLEVRPGGASLRRGQGGRPRGPRATLAGRTPAA